MPYLDAEGRERDVYRWQRRMVMASLSEPEGRLRFFISIILDRPIVVLRGKKNTFLCHSALSHCGCHQCSGKVTDKCDYGAVACCGL